MTLCVPTSADRLRVMCGFIPPLSYDITDAPERKFCKRTDYVTHITECTQAALIAAIIDKHGEPK